MSGRHRKRTTRALNIGVASVATATATALTVAAAPAPEPQAARARDALVELAAAIDYTQLITDSSNTLNNLLFIQGNVGGAAASLWNPLATTIPGGLLPTFFAGTEQEDLTSLAGLLAVLGQIASLDLSDLSGVPGLPADAATTILAGLLPGLAPALAAVAPLLAAIGGPLAAVQGVLDVLNGVNVVLEGLNLPLIGGIPDLDDLIPGLTVTQTNYASGYQWPILGLDGSTTVSNTFAQLDSLTLSLLVEGLVDGLDIPDLAGLPVLDGLVTDALDALALLDGVSTPSVTAWLPAGSGNYGLPFGSEIGWLATMPTIAIGPISLLGIPETVIAIPIAAGGVVLPLGLASFGQVSTPGIVFPTATGVSTLGGTTLQSFGIPLLGIGVTSLNVLNSTYVGTNGFNYNSGTTVTTITTPFGVLPLVYSLGSVNAGTTGFGFTLPSLFTVGLLPSFQVGTAPTQQSPDGLIPPTLLNLGLAVPTQLTDVVTLLGLPDPGAPLEALLTPVFNATLAPLGAQLTALLDENAGPAVNDLASFIEQLTGLLAEATYGLPGANSPEPTTTTLALRTEGATVDVPEVTSTPSDDTEILDVTVESTPEPLDAELVVDEESEESDETNETNESDESDEPGQHPLRNTSLADALSDARDNLRTAVNDTRDQFRQATERVAGSIRDAFGNNRGDDESSAGDDNTSQVNDNDDGGNNGGDNNNGGSGDGD